MDDSVIRAMARWPTVPAVFGYLALDARGRWILQGRPLDHEKTVNFINRNYDRDEHGRWFFQNGPQRAYVTLIYTPWVYRLHNGTITTHTNAHAETVTDGLLDEQGRLLLNTEHGIGLLHDQDLPEAVDRLTGADGKPLDEQKMLEALEALQAGRKAELYLPLGGKPAPLAPIRSEDVAGRFQFDPRPAPRPEEADRAVVAEE